MEPVDLTGIRAPIANVMHIVDCAPTVHIKPNEEALKLLHKGRRSRYGAKQSEHSKHRQNFITGMERHHLNVNELRARKAYEDEWHDRIKEVL